MNKIIDADKTESSNTNINEIHTIQNILKKRTGKTIRLLFVIPCYTKKTHVLNHFLHNKELINLIHTLILLPTETSNEFLNNHSVIPVMDVEEKIKSFTNQSSGITK